MAMFDQLMKRAAATAVSAAERRRNSVEAAWAEVPDATVRREGESLILLGRALRRRWLGDVRLRFARWTRR